MVPVYSFSNNFYEKGYQFSFWDCSIITYLSILIVHYLIILNDSSIFNPGNTIFYILQLVITFIIILICENYSDFEIKKTLGFMLGNNYLGWLTIIMTCSFCLIPTFIVRRAEFFFGGFIANKIKQKDYKDFFIEKFYQKKVEQMTRVVRSVAKFKRIYYNNIEENQEDNLADEKMRKIVDEFKDKRDTVLKKNRSNLK